MPAATPTPRRSTWLALRIEEIIRRSAAVLSFADYIQPSPMPDMKGLLDTELENGERIHPA